MNIILEEILKCQAYISNMPIPSDSTCCPVGLMLLQNFQTCIEALPQNVGEADNTHPLASFAVREGEDAWEKYDGPLNTLLQRPSHELYHLVQVGDMGLIGLCQFLEYLVKHHGVSGYLLEGKLEQLMVAIDTV
jgi:hypothetical protein